MTVQVAVAVVVAVPFPFLGMVAVTVAVTVAVEVIWPSDLRRRELALVRDGFCRHRANVEAVHDYHRCCRIWLQPCLGWMGSVSASFWVGWSTTSIEAAEPIGLVGSGSGAGGW